MMMQEGVVKRTFSSVVRIPPIGYDAMWMIQRGQLLRIFGLERFFPQPLQISELAGKF